MNLLPITLTMAGAAALMNIWIGLRVGVLRRRHGVLVGDGDHPAIRARMRAHSNFVEYTPIFLILLGLIEAAEGSPSWLWLVAVLFMAGRLLHVFGMDRGGANRLRMGGMALTLLPVLGLAVYAVVIPYLQKRPTITYAEALPSPASTESATNGFDRRS